MKQFRILAILFLVVLNACTTPDAEKTSKTVRESVDPVAEPKSAPEKEALNHVTVGGTDWTVANLSTARFADGSEIPRADDLATLANLGEAGQPAWCYPDFDSDKGAAYGMLYNWYAVTDPRGICPRGWRVANADDWAALIEAAGGQGVAGTALKSDYGWYGGGNGTDALAFSALPVGAASALNGYSAEEKVAAFWSPEEVSANYAEYRVIHAPHDGIFLNEDLKMTGMSVRCVRE